MNGVESAVIHQSGVPRWSVTTAYLLLFVRVESNCEIAINGELLGRVPFAENAGKSSGRQRNE